jgi:7-carboxy-7-deazaguanine synthase
VQRSPEDRGLGAPAADLATSSATALGWLSEIFVSIQGEGARAGEKHLFVRFAGCNIRCRYCDTPDSLIRVAECEVTWMTGERERIDNPVRASALAAIVDRCCADDPSIAMIALTGGEPMVQHAFLAAWLSAYPPPRPCLLETNATLVSGLDAVLQHVAVVSADVKLPSNSGERELWDEHRRFLSACTDVDVYVKLPVDERSDACEVRRGARLVAEAAPHATLFVQPITGARDSHWHTSEHRLLELVACAQAEMPRTRLRPQLHKLIGVR